MRYAILLCLMGASVSVAACGSSNSSSDAAGSTGPTNAAAANAQGLKLAQCIRAHGVPNFPDPSGNGKGGILIQQSDRSGSGATTKVNGVPVDGPAFQAAMKACARYEPNGGHPTAAQTAKARARALAMSRCMRSHGVTNFPDPTFGTGPNGALGVQLNGSGIDPSSPAFQSAQKACGSIFGGAGPVVQKAG